MIQDLEFQQAARALRGASEIVIACHINPDGDALGSMLGLASYLEREGKKVLRTWGSGKISVPPQYSSLPTIDRLVNHKEVPEAPECFVAIDCGGLSRLELLEKKFEAAAITLNIDHHQTNDRFADINLVDDEAASSSEIAYELIKRMGGRLTKQEATCFYTGIVTDTGRFQYPNASVQTLRTAAELRDYGVEHHQIAEDVFESYSFDYLQVLGIVLSRARLTDGIIWSWIDREDLGDLEMEETEDFIDVLRTVRDSEVAAILKQRPDRSYKVSLRSRGAVDVAAVAEIFGGGGHKRAAGFNLRGKPEEVIAQIKAKLDGS